MGERWRRVGVTVLGLVLFVVIHRIGLAGLDQELLQQFPGMDLTVFSVGAIALTPWVTAFVVVELVLLVVPSLRRFRLVGADRSSVGVAIRVVWLVVCVVQAYGLAVGMEQMRVGYNSVVLSGGLAWRLVVVATLTAASALLGWTALQVHRHGLGALFVWFMATRWLTELSLFIETLWAMPTVSIDDALPPAICVAIAGGATYWLVQARGRTGLWLSAAGVLPASAGLTGLFALSMWVPELWTAKGFMALAVVVVFGTVVLSLLQTSPPLATDNVDSQYETDRWRAAGFGVAFSVVLGVLWWGSGTANPDLYLDPISVALTFALGWDIVSEWRARDGKTLVAAGSIYRVRDVQHVLDALESAGINGHVRGVRLRQLMHFLSPWAAMDVLVAREDVARTRALMSPGVQCLSDPKDMPSPAAS